VSQRVKDHHALNLPDHALYAFNLSWTFIQGVDDETRPGPVLAQL
jgi:hypothetical protein